jgi:hypothetical protein
MIVIICHKLSPSASAEVCIELCTYMVFCVKPWITFGVGHFTIHGLLKITNMLHNIWICHFLHYVTIECSQIFRKYEEDVSNQLAYKRNYNFIFYSERTQNMWTDFIKCRCHGKHAYGTLFSRNYVSECV